MCALLWRKLSVVEQGGDILQERMQSLLKMQAELGSRKQDEIDQALAELDAEANEEARKEQQKVADQIQKLKGQKQRAIKKKTDEQELLELQCESENERHAMQMQHRAEMLEFTKLLDEEESRQIKKIQDKAAQQEEQRYQKRRLFERQFHQQFKKNEDALREEYERVSLICMLLARF